MKLMRFTMVPAFAALFYIHTAHAGNVVQIDTSSLFNGRPINTVVNGVVVPMDNNIDGAGGLCTLSAAKILGGSTEHVIPTTEYFPRMTNTRSSARLRQ